jgi:IS5 family transposase
LKKLKTVVGRVWRDVGRQLEKIPGALRDKAADLLARNKRVGADEKMPHVPTYD